MKYNLQKENGFTLVETLVAITILLVAVVGPMSIAAQGLQGSFFAREQTVAIFLAQEGLESIQKLRDDAALGVYAGMGEQDATLCSNGRDDLSSVSCNNTDFWDWYNDLAANTECDDTNGCDLDPSEIYGYRDCGTNAANCNLNFDPDCVGGRCYKYDSSLDSSIYTRQIFLAENPPDEVSVRVDVSWRAGLFGDTNTLTLQSKLFNQYE